MIDRKGCGSVLACFLLMCSVLAGVGGPAEACVAPPPEPFCTKALTLAMAGPPTLLLPGGGSFDVPLVLVFKLLDFPPGTGICPAAPYSADIHVTATCDPTGADGSGSLLGESISTGFNLLDVTVTVPAGPPRICSLQALATVTLIDGMVLTETAESSACLVEPAPGDPTEPRIELEMIGLAGEEIARIHPGDPVTRTYRITNHDPDETFTGMLTVNSISESRMPGMSGPMPEGTAVVSISDPVQGDNFPFALSEIPEFQLGTGGDVCIPLSDPHEIDILEQTTDVVLLPGGTTILQIVSRPWGMCADGSCGRHDLLLDGEFSDTDAGFGCSTFVTAADTSMPSGYECDDGGEVAEFPPPVDPNLPKLTFSGSPLPDFEPELDMEVVQIALLEDGIVVAESPSSFSERFDDEYGRVQMQWAGNFEVDSFFDVFTDLTIEGGASGPAIATEVVSLPMTGAPTGFERTAPYAMALTEITDLSGGGLKAFAELTVQVSAVGIDDLGNRRRLQFENILFTRDPGGSGLRGALTGGLLEGGEGNDILAVEVSMDLRGFLSPEPQGGLIFEDGFESGNVSRWSNSNP